MAANTEYTKIKESTISAFFSKLKAFFWPKADVVNLDVIDVDLAPVALSGDYEDLDNAPACPVYDSLPASGGLLANAVYDVGMLTGAVTITLDTASQLAGQLNVYTLCFSTGSTPPSITFPSSIAKWVGNCIDSATGAPVLSGEKDYEISIRGDKAVITEYA